MADNTNDISGRVGLDITDFKANIAQLNREIKVIDTGFKAAAAGLEDWGASAEGLQNRIDALNQMIDLQKKKVEALTNEYQKVSAEKGADSKAAEDLQIRINKETESLNKNQKELNDTTNALNNFGKEEDQESEKTNKLHSALGRMGEGLKNIGGAVAKAAVTGIAAVGTAATAAAVGAFKLAKDVGETADNLLTLSAKTGISVKQLQEMDYASRFVDVDLETMTGSMAKLTKSMSSASTGLDKWMGSIDDTAKALYEFGKSGASVDEIFKKLSSSKAVTENWDTKEIKQLAADLKNGKLAYEDIWTIVAEGTEVINANDKAFSWLGVRVQDDNGHLRDSKQVWLETIDALGKVENETERNALAMQIFGKSAQELNPLIKAGSKELENLAFDANELGAVMSDEAIAAAGQFDDSMQTLGATLKGLAGTVGVVAVPAIRDIVETVIGIVPQITDAVKTGDWAGAGQAVATGLSGLLTQVTSALPGMATMGVTIITTLVSSLVAAIPQVLPGLVQAAIQLINALVQMLANNGPMLITAGINALTQLITGIVQALPQLIPVAVSLIMALANGIVSNLPQLLNAAVQIILALVDGILQLLPQLIPVAIQAIVTLATGLINALPQLIDKLPEIIETIVNVLIDNLPLLIEAAIQIIVALAVGIVENLPKLIEAAMRIIGALYKGMLSAIGDLLRVVPEIFAQLREAMGKIDWAQLGLNIINGIIDGVKSMGKNLVDGVVNLAKGALDAAKNLLGIKSPSRVFRDQVGKMIGLGIVEGIDDSAGAVNKAMSQLNNQITSGGRFKVSVPAIGSTRQAVKSGVTQQITVMVNCNDLDSIPKIARLFNEFAQAVDQGVGLDAV
jgi:phage-related protein